MNQISSFLVKYRFEITTLGPVHTRTERNGTERNGTERNGTERNGTERNGTERNGTERNGTERNDVELFQKTKKFLQVFTRERLETFRTVPKSGRL